MLNREGYPDPTAEMAVGKIMRKGGVMREADIKRMDNARLGWSEAEEQEALINWADMSKGRYPQLSWLFHIPNGGSRHPVEALHLKRMGVKPGVPDLFLPYPVKPYHGLWIEMKSQGGRPTALQKDWIEYLRSAGYAAYVCMGFSAAQDCLIRYIEGRIPTDEEQGRKDDIIWRGGA